MDTAMTLHALELGRMTTVRTRTDDRSRIQRLMRENERLLEENERLRQIRDDLAGSAETWIRLYEAALRRAGGGAVVCREQDHTPA